jgi:hypothetical protein
LLPAGNLPVNSLTPIGWEGEDRLKSCFTGFTGAGIKPAFSVGLFQIDLALHSKNRASLPEIKS